MRPFFSLVLIAPKIAITAASGPGAVPDLAAPQIGSTQPPKPGAVHPGKPATSTMNAPGYQGWILIRYAERSGSRARRQRIAGRAPTQTPNPQVVPAGTLATWIVANFAT